VAPDSEDGSARRSLHASLHVWRLAVEEVSPSDNCRDIENSGAWHLAAKEVPSGDRCRENEE